METAAAGGVRRTLLGTTAVLGTASAGCAALFVPALLLGVPLPFGGAAANWITVGGLLGGLVLLYVATRAARQAIPAWLPAAVGVVGLALSLGVTQAVIDRERVGAPPPADAGQRSAAGLESDPRGAWPALPPIRSNRPWLALALSLLSSALLVQLMLYLRRASTNHTELIAAYAQVDNWMLELDRHRRELEESEKRYRRLFDHVSIPVVLSTPDGRLLAANPAFLHLLGYESEEALQAKQARELFVNPSDRDNEIANLTDGSPSRNHEVRLKTRNGEHITVLLNALLVNGADGQPSHIESVLTDITPFRELEQRRAQLEQEERLNQRLKSVGALAAGIAHEINTPMQFISDSVYYIKTALDDIWQIIPQYQALVQEHKRAGASEQVERIEAAEREFEVAELSESSSAAADRALEGVSRVSRIVQAMREFAHPNEEESIEADLNQAIMTTLTICRSEYKHIAEVETDFGDLPAVRCQLGDINQALLNLIVNAAHAIEQKGSSGTGLISIATRCDAEWIDITISDTGCGISESVQARIFDPFFTTKKVGKGTGQGLALVRAAIVDRHGGRVLVNSTVGQGTTFTIKLPVDRRLGDVAA